MSDTWKRGLESRGTVKDAHSPAGQEFHVPPSHADLPDCPRCQYGTPMERKEGWKCIDCGAELTEAEVRNHNNNNRKQ
jgi:hypothetical protein